MANYVSLEYVECLLCVVEYCCFRFRDRTMDLGWPNMATEIIVLGQRGIVVTYSFHAA